MLTGNTTLPTSAGTPVRLTLICSSSPSPAPVRLSPICSTEPSGLCRLLKNTKWLSDRTRPLVSSMIADASRSKSAPVVVRGSQPSPTTTAVRPGACLESETLPPLLRLTLTVAPCENEDCTNVLSHSQLQATLRISDIIRSCQYLRPTISSRGNSINSAILELY